MSRDKRGYDLIYLIWDQRRRGRPEPRLLYCCRLPVPLRVGPPPFDEDVRLALEQANPEITFDWPALLKSLLTAVNNNARPAAPTAPPFKARRPAAGGASMGSNGYRPSPFARPAPSMAGSNRAAGAGGASGLASTGRPPVEAGARFARPRRPEAETVHAESWLAAADTAVDGGENVYAAADAHRADVHLLHEESVQVIETIETTIVSITTDAGDVAESIVRETAARHEMQEVPREVDEEVENFASSAASVDSEADGKDEEESAATDRDRPRRRRRRRRGGRPRLAESATGAGDGENGATTASAAPGLSSSGGPESD